MDQGGSRHQWLGAHSETESTRPFRIKNLVSKKQDENFSTSLNLLLASSSKQLRPRKRRVTFVKSEQTENLQLTVEDHCSGGDYHNWKGTTELQECLQ